MASSSLKLLGSWISPYVMRARIALNVKSVEYEFVEQQFGPKSELLLKSNPVHKKIPVLIHNEKPICESLVIVQYIDEFWSSAPQILPSDPYERATSRFWAAYIDDKLFPAIRTVRMAQGDEERKVALDSVYEGLALVEDAFKKTSNGKKFFGGDSIGYLDIALGCNLGWVRVTEKMNNVKLFDEEKTPCLYQWTQDFCDDVAVKDLIPETDKLIEVLKMMMGSRMKPAAQN